MACLRSWPAAAAAALLSSLVVACSDDPGAPNGALGQGGSEAPASLASLGDPHDVPLDGVGLEQQKAFFEGDALFDVALHEADGLGPLYTRSACGACHDTGTRGPGAVQKMSVVLADGVTTSPDQSLLPFGHTVHPLCTAGGKTPIVPPDDPRVRVTLRVGPPVLGRGYMEAVMDSEILRVEAEQAGRDDGIHGRVNHVVYASEQNPDPTFNAHQKGDQVIGRFGLKARIATLDEFTADALQGDMGVTSPLRPTEIPNPDGITDDLKPGVDVTAKSVNARATYLRLTAIPRRPLGDEGARALFSQVKCDVCHVPSMRTEPRYPISQLAGIDAPIFTDLLLHDLGDELADGMIDGDAQSRDWRTAPLLGLRFDKTYLHDGRAHTIEEAVLLHDGTGSEAKGSVALYRALPEADREALLAFVGAL